MAQVEDKRRRADDGGADETSADCVSATLEGAEQGGQGIALALERA